MIDPTRRGFLAGTGALTLAVAIGCGGDGKGTRIRHAEASGEFKANLYITVMPDGRIGLVVNKAEFGQGVGTAYATLAAEELGVAVDQIDVEYAGSHKDMRTSFGMQVTGGSTSTVEGYKAVRKSAASAREMLVAAAAASWKVPTSQCSVGGGKVLHAASARSIGYGDLTKLAARESVPSKPKLKAVKDFTVIGKHDRRVDARSKVDGTAKFGIDTVVPNMVNAYVIHGPVFGARATKVSADAARKRPGVIDIFAFAGGVAVVADKYWQAMAAAREVEVTWSPGEVPKLDTEEMQRAMRAYDDDGTSVKDSGNAGKALGRAKTKLRAIYEAPYLCHAPLEPQNCTVSVTGKTAEVWAPNQSATVVQAFVSDAVGIAFENVKVHTTLLGGGFGRRLVADACAQAAIISQRVKRPVKLVWSRESDMTQAFYRPVYSVHFEGAVDDGRVTALRTHCISQSILLSSAETMEAAMPGIPRAIRGRVIESLLAVFSTNSMGDLFATEGLKNTPYQLGNHELTASPVKTKLPVASWRSVGNSVTGFAMESFVDELAHLAKQDPLAFRRRMVPEKSRQARVLDALAKLSSWGSPPPAGLFRGIARHFSFETEVGEVAEVEIVDGRIKVRRVFCVVDCGVAVNPDIVRAQMEGGIIFGLSAALDQEITIKNGVVQQRNYDTFPVLRMYEAPEIVVQILPSDEDPTGVGEPGLPPIAAAVGNAIFAGTGVRLRRMPLQRAWNERGGERQ